MSRKGHYPSFFMGIGVKNEMSREKHAIFFTKLMIIAILLLLVCLVKGNNPDPDSYFLAATGRYIVQNKTVPKINPFCIHEEFGIIIQQWVPAILNYVLFESFGEWGLVWYAIVALYIQIVLFYVYISIFTKSWHSRWICSLLGGFLLAIFATSRPTSISFCIILLELIILEKVARGEKQKRTLWWLVPISIAEINFHAALWPGLFIMMLPYIFFEKMPKGWRIAEIKEFFFEWYEEKREYLKVIPCMIVTALLNPNGIRGILYLIYSYGNLTDQISELQSPTMYSVFGIVIILCVCLVCVYICKLREKKDMKTVYMALGCLLLAMMHLRNLWYLLIGIGPIAAEWIPSVVKESDTPFLSKKRYVLAELILIAAAAMAIHYEWTTTEIDIKDRQMAPVFAADYLDSLDSSQIVLYTEFNNGAYMEWRGYRVYIDARPELYEKKINGKEDIFEEYMTIRGNELDYKEFLEKYHFTHMIVSDREALYTYLTLSPEYQIVVEGTGYHLFERTVFDASFPK